LQEAVPEIDANLVSFYRGDQEGRSGLELDLQVISYVNFKVTVLEFAHK